MASLQDQLLQAGLVDKKKAKKVGKEQRKEAKVRHKGQSQPDENKEQAKRALLEKADRDRLLRRLVLCLQGSPARAPLGTLSLSQE